MSSLYKEVGSHWPSSSINWSVDVFHTKITLWKLSWDVGWLCEAVYKQGIVGSKGYLTLYSYHLNVVYPPRHVLLASCRDYYQLEYFIGASNKPRASVLAVLAPGRRGQDRAHHCSVRPAADTMLSFTCVSPEMESMVHSVILFKCLQNEGVCLSGSCANESVLNAQLDLKSKSS